jgi:hypothetical protein
MISIWFLNLSHKLILPRKSLKIVFIRFKIVGSVCKFIIFLNDKNPSN